MALSKGAKWEAGQYMFYQTFFDYANWKVQRDIYIESLQEVEKLDFIAVESKEYEKRGICPQERDFF